MQYEEDMKIDETALDVEWLNQPILAMKYGRHYADCFRLHQQAEENLKVVKAELIKKINDDPDKYLGVGVKATGPNVEACYRDRKEHKVAKEQWIAAQFELNIAAAVKSEISFSRKAALENLVILHGQSYFAGPKMPRDLTSEVQHKEAQKTADAIVIRKMRRST
jgi:hypothetical protein